MIKFDIITIFPSFFECFLKESIIARAIKKKIIKVKIYNLRDFTKDRHFNVDDKPYGGGIGMVMKIEPIWRAVEYIKKTSKTSVKKSKIILFSPRGKKFTQRVAWNYSKMKQLILICGRYEGVDERVTKYIATDCISVGDYVLMGGEIPAQLVMEAVARLIPGVLGKKQLLKERIPYPKRVFIEYPQYTRPAIFRPKKGVEWKVPKVLLSGDHKKIKEWRERHKKLIG